MEHPMINVKESVERSVAAPRIVSIGGAPDTMARIGHPVSKLTGYAPALPTPFNVEGDESLSATKRNSKPIDGCGPYAKHLTSKSVEASNGYEQVKALIALPFVGVDFCCNVALGAGGGTSS
jgi:hypothetical protein